MEEPRVSTKQGLQNEPSGRRKGTSIRSHEHRILVEYLIAARKAAGLTQQELAHKVGKHQSHISRIEQSERDVSVIDLILWCKATGVSSGNFIEKVENEIEIGNR